MARAAGRRRPGRKWQPHRGRSLPWQLLSYSALLAATAFALAPLWHIAVLSLEPLAPAREMAAWRLPDAPGLENFAALFARTGFLRWTFNSLVVAAAVTATGVLLSATAGYALSRFKFFGRLAVLNSLLLTQIFPATMLLLPIFLILGQLQLIDTFVGLALVYLATVLPFCIWQMKNFYDGVPESVEEAAAMDGCTPAEIFRRVVLPISAPGLAVTALFSFAAAWNEYVVAAILLPNSALFTLPLGLRSLDAPGGGLPPGLFAAGAVLVSLPMLALYLLLSRFLVTRVHDIRIRY
ncbi:MAG: carbohydrate ABC transporter permease [Chthoniobacterales bacterium]|jgi:arabinogalactan oligomer / maltooligosaccharide transport system permease protein|nr:carbohydrate ABC transporter permease [Chthoniobacterales bacterium]